MEKEFVNYDQALKLKELGFDEPCFGWYRLSNKRLCGEYEVFTFQNNFPHIEFVDVPTFSQAFEWFREKWDLRSWVESTSPVTFDYVIATSNPKFSRMVFEDDTVFKTNNEAESACLDKLIEIVESKSE